MQNYDFIIVGAGSAGCVLANRLSADPANRVLIVEAGKPDRHPLIRIPGGYSSLFRKSFDWAYYSTPQPRLNNRRIYLPRGKTLGGSSATNAMAYVRGNRADFDSWAAQGNRGWSFREVEPYFERAEATVNITHNRYRTPFGTAFLEAGVQAGLDRNPNYNGEQQCGVAPFQFTIKDGQRHSAAAAFLKPAMQRPNLTVMTGRGVERIIIEKDRAVGVEVDGQRIGAKREVIVSAGGFNSPQLLLLSGIGDAAELKQHGIEVKKQLPGVGKNYQDHLFFALSTTASQQVGINRFLKPWPKAKATLEYLFKKTGPLTIGPLEVVGFEKLGDPAAKVPNVQYHFSPSHMGPRVDEMDMYDVSQYPYHDGYSVLPTLLYPKSKGFVGLQSASPKAAPLIEPNFLDHDADLETLIEAGKRAVEILGQPAFDAYRTEIDSYSGLHSDEDWAQYIRKIVETVYHPVGTCKMGHGEMAVVDNELRLHGIEGLRVVDASIMPSIIGGNTNAAVYMIAEKAADLILGRASAHNPSRAARMNG